MSKAVKNASKATIDQLEKAMLASIDQSEGDLEKYVATTESVFADLCDKSANCLASRKQVKRANQTLAFFSRLPQAYADYFKARFEKFMLVVGSTVEIGGAGEYDSMTSACRIGYTLPDGSTVFDKSLLKKKDIENAVYGFVLIDGDKFAHNWQQLNKFDAVDLNTLLSTPHKKAEEKAAKLYDIEGLKKLFKRAYKRSDQSGKIWLADICREKGIELV